MFHWLNYCIAMAIVILVAFMLLDAAFKPAMQRSLWLLGVRTDAGVELTDDLRFENLGLRICIIAVLVMLITLGTLGSIVLKLLTTNGVSLRDALFAALTLCVVLGIVTQWEYICLLGFRMRIGVRSRWLSFVCDEMLKHWPSISGPCSKLDLEVISSPDSQYPDTVAVRPKSQNYPLTDRFGPLVHRHNNGILLDLNEYPDWRLEYHPGGKRNDDVAIKYEGFVVIDAVREIRNLSNGLYLVKYEQTYKPD